VPKQSKCREGDCCAELPDVVRGFSLVLHDPKGSHYESPLTSPRISLSGGEILRFAQDDSSDGLRMTEVRDSE